MGIVPSTRRPDPDLLPPDAGRRQVIGGLAAGWAGSVGLWPGRARAAEPVLLGLDGELSVEDSTSAQAIQAGIEIAMDEINAIGGVLGGRPLALVARDNRALPPHSARNMRDFAALPTLVGVFCGRYSPTVLEAVPLAHDLRLPLLDPWASADGIIQHGHTPSYTFRLSMTDSWAMPAMAAHAARQGRRSLGLLAINTSWGRSCERAMLAHVAARGEGQRLVGARWYNYTDGPAVFRDKFLDLVRAGAEALVFVGNFREGSDLVRSIAAQPESERRPVMAHSGVMGGDFFTACGEALDKVDVTVVQTFGFAGAARARTAAVRAAAQKRLAGIGNNVPSAAGLAQSYDLMHIVARAIDAARSTDRAALRDALERARPYAGLIRDYPAPFTATRHEALSPDDVYLARFDSHGVLVHAR